MERDILGEEVSPPGMAAVFADVREPDGMEPALKARGSGGICQADLKWFLWVKHLRVQSEIAEALQ